MWTWFVRNIGAGPEFVEHVDDVRLAVQQPWTLGIGLALLVPVGVGILLWQWRRLRSAPPSLRLLLTATRVAILGLLVFVLSGPFLPLEYRTEKKPIVAFLFDQSQSMLLDAGPFESERETREVAAAAGYRTADGPIDSTALRALNQTSRARLAQTVVETNAGTLLAPLDKRFELQFYRF